MCPPVSSKVSKKSHATLRYTSMRVSVFLGCLLVSLILGHFQVLPVSGETGVIFLVLLAAVASAPLSYVLLSRQRDEMSAEISGRVDGIRTRTASKFAAQAAEEDAADDAVRAANGSTAAAPQN